MTFGIVAAIGTNCYHAGLDPARLYRRGDYAAASRESHLTVTRLELASAWVLECWTILDYYHYRVLYLVAPRSFVGSFYKPRGKRCRGMWGRFYRCTYIGMTVIRWNIMDVYMCKCKWTTALSELGFLDNPRWHRIPSLPYIKLPSFMASDTLTARQPSLPPTYTEPIESRPRPAAAIPQTFSPDASARGCSTSIEPESSTAEAATPTGQSTSQTRAESVEPISSTQVRWIASPRMISAFVHFAMRTHQSDADGNLPAVASTWYNRHGDFPTDSWSWWGWDSGVFQRDGLGVFLSSKHYFRWYGQSLVSHRQASPFVRSYVVPP